jgi:hypothetical protein
VSHLEDDDTVHAEALVSLLTLLFVFEESSPFLDLDSEMNITLRLTDMVWTKLVLEPRYRKSNKQ